MNVLDTQMHLVTFLITMFESALLFFVIIYYLSRPSDKGRMRYMVLLFLLILYNVFSGLFPDQSISIPIQIQVILAFLGGITVSMYFVYYIYKTFKLEKLKFYAIQGSIWFLFLPFIVLFVLPYMITGDAELSRKLIVILPFVFSIMYVYVLSKSLWKRYKEQTDIFEKEEIIGVYLSVLLWATLPIIVYFDGSQLVENGTTNAGFMIMSILFVRSAILKSRKDYNLLMQSRAELKKANHNLQKKVEERTRQLNEANEKRVNAFINLVHETKTPLTLINNYLDEFIEKNGNSEEIEITKINMDKLTRNMINYFDLYKINKGESIYNHDQLADFTKILKNNLMLFKSWAKQKNIQIKEKIDSGISVNADPEAINRIINNLLDNAIKYTKEEGMVEVELSQDIKFVYFQVKDNGKGISEEFQKHIFEPYYQVNHPKSNVQGIGLGLSIVKITVEELKGEIELKSTPGLGTVIGIRIPQGTINHRKVATHQEVNNVLHRNESDFKDDSGNPNFQNVLIVEDNIGLLRLMQNKLTVEYNIYTAKNGIEAINKLKGIPVPDLIVSDIMMDDMDGYELIKALSSQQAYKHIPFIFITAKTTEEDKLKGLSLGAIDFISKPFNVTELTRKIKSILANFDLQKQALIHHASNSIRNGHQSKAKNGKELSLEEKCKKLKLSDRAAEIIELTIQGNSVKESADVLFIAPSTAAKHLANVYKKLDVKSKIELMKKLESIS